MIVLKISNASEPVAAKLGKFLESLTPDGLDASTVEDVLIRKSVENLQAEGLKGEIAAVRGLNLDGKHLSIDDGLHVRRVQTF
jgi:hypothetical protein